ncbi:hypothetical protein BDV93DRAFT_609760 [Ceratobasidium sp. AG-I]|nr:hypothetical protein BDV93DRAFT_609760 [Ceratobasidium sp. AG-I]
MLPIGTKAYTFLGLNAVRALSIFTLILVFASSIMVMVDDVNAVRRGSDTPTGTLTDASGNEFELDCDYVDGSTVPLQPAGVLFAILNRLFIIGQCIVLILSEFGWPEAFFVNFLPVLGPDHGVGILGAMQVFLGAAVLSHHVPTFALVSAFFLFSIGILNILLGLIFRSSIKERRMILSWRNKAPPQVERAASAISAASDLYSHAKDHYGSKKSDLEKGEKGAHQGGAARKSFSFGFGRQGGLKAEFAGYTISKPMETVPKYTVRPLQMKTGRESPDSWKSAGRI